MGKERAAVLGVGQTKYDTTYPGSMAGMLREAATNALEMSGKRWDDIDAVIMGKAPDFFEGVMMPEVYLAKRRVTDLCLCFPCPVPFLPSGGGLLLLLEADGL